jgi:hypothetical protein
VRPPAELGHKHESWFPPRTAFCVLVQPQPLGVDRLVREGRQRAEVTETDPRVLTLRTLTNGTADS